MGASEPGEQGFAVPDDASELEPDRLAWLTEERSRRRRARARRLVLTRRWERFGLSGPIVFLCLLATAAVGALAIVFVPRPSSPVPTARPLATSGRLLPHAALVPDVPTPDLDGVTRDTVDLQDLRPALLLVVPADCACTTTVAALYAQASEFRLTTWYLGPDGAQARARLSRLDAAASGGGARWAVDPKGEAAGAVGASGLTAVLVRADGVVATVLTDVPLDPTRVPALELDLAQLPARTA